jgi:hypothetical protein
MRVIFCCDPLNRKVVDPAYAEEFAAASAAGLATALVSYEALVDEGDAEPAVRRVAPGGGAGAVGARALGVYRGWMLRPEVYARLYDALMWQGIALINTPEEYRHCHYLPESYSVIEGRTPATIWLANGPDIEMAAVLEAVRPFGEKPLIVKDFVKSRKHEWAEACYIPSAADRDGVARVVRRFLALQGGDLNEGLVLREFVPFEPLAAHSKGGMPMTQEFRLFFLDGEVLLASEYWEEGEYADGAPPVDEFLEVARRVRSHFFTMDVAKRLDGDWLIVELGDGQVAGLPERADAQTFYHTLAERLEG